MTNSVQTIALEKLVAHPANPNKMSMAAFGKLVRNIERTGRYEPLIVRPYPNKSEDVATVKADVQKDDDAKDSRLRGNDIKKTSPSTILGTGDYFQIINGHHRWQALTRLGYKAADCVVWDIDDEEADILLATLNRLCGSDELGKKLELLKRLNKSMESRELAKLIPQTAKQIERLTHLKMPSRPAEPSGKYFSNPLVFFVNDVQQEVIEKALSAAGELVVEKTRAARRAAALARIAGEYLSATGGQETIKN
jgi:hypothetical protein